MVLLLTQHYNGVFGQRGPVPEDPQAANQQEANSRGRDLVRVHPDSAGPLGAALHEDTT